MVHYVPRQNNYSNYHVRMLVIKCLQKGKVLGSRHFLTQNILVKTNRTMQMVSCLLLTVLESLRKEMMSLGH